MKHVWIPMAAAAALSAAGCGISESVEGALDAAYAAGEVTSAPALKAHQAEKQLIDGLEFRPFPYRQVRALESAPAVSDTCGVSYHVSGDAWGVVPDLRFSCADAEAQAKALADASERLRSLLSRSGGEYEARLAAVQQPLNALRTHGAALAYAGGLGLSFDLKSCVRRVGDLLARSVSSEAALACETFLAPGAALDAYRERLRDANRRAEGLAATVPVTPASAVAPEVAARCDAVAGSPGLSVPGSVTGIRGGRNLAYAIVLHPGESVVMDLGSGDFDTELQLYDGACGTRLTRDDDGGGGTDSRIRWTSPLGGEHVLVVSSYGGSGSGRFDLTVSTESGERSLTPQDQEAVRAFVAWVTNAPEAEFLAAWRGNAPSSLQMGCALQERFKSKDALQAAVLGEAMGVCMGALDRAAEARKLMQDDG